MLPVGSSTHVWRSFPAALLALLALAGLLLPSNTCLSTLTGRATTDRSAELSDGDRPHRPPGEHGGHSASIDAHDTQCPRPVFGRAAVTTRPWSDSVTSLGLRPNPRRTQGITAFEDGFLLKASCPNATAQPLDVNMFVLRI